MILVTTTLPTYKMLSDPEYWNSWLSNANEIRENAGTEVRYFCAIETDSRDLIPFEPLLARLSEIGGGFWSFSLDDNAQVLTTANRLRRICMGHNLGIEYGMEERASHILFLAADTRAPDDVIPRLLEVDRGVVSCHIPTYCLDGPRSAEPVHEHMDVRIHMESCACMLIRRDVFSRLRWRVDVDRNLTDDPAMHADVRELLGQETYSRHDVLAVHYPESIPRIEDRHSEEDRTYHR